MLRGVLVEKVALASTASIVVLSRFVTLLWKWLVFVVLLTTFVFVPVFTADSEWLYIRNGTIWIRFLIVILFGNEIFCFIWKFITVYWIVLHFHCIWCVARTTVFPRSTLVFLFVLTSSISKNYQPADSVSGIIFVLRTTSSSILKRKILYISILLNNWILSNSYPQ